MSAPAWRRSETISLFFFVHANIKGVLLKNVKNIVFSLPLQFAFESTMVTISPFSNTCTSSTLSNTVNSLPTDNTLTHYQTTNFRLFQTERVCRRQFQIDKIRRKLSKQVKNTAGKGEMARYEQFLLFPQRFQTACFPEASKGVIVWEWFKGGPTDLGTKFLQKY